MLQWGVQKAAKMCIRDRMDTVRVGFIGLGMRGPGAVVRFTHIPGIQIKALCDIRPVSYTHLDVYKRQVFL